ncbi:MAG: hypothetical protein WBC73_10850 [Phormidesmis sp.]
MMPKFATPLARVKVEQLMQPALIRVIDNIRKQLEISRWEGAYEEELRWPQGTALEQQQEYAALQKRLHGVPPEEHDRVANLMSQLPQPSPLYTLRLTKAGHEDQTIDIWALCYQVCAAATEADLTLGSLSLHSIEERTLDADIGLFDEYGEVDWRSLDDKTKGLVENIFQALPA